MGFRRLGSPQFIALGVPALWLASCAVFGQTTGSIGGRVTDPAGAPLPGVTIEATSLNLQRARVVTTGSNGGYRFAALPPGRYHLRARLSGFRSAQAATTVALDAMAAVDLTLELSAEEDVVVHGEMPFLDTTSTMSSTGYTSRVINQLPCGRDYAAIVLSNPSVNQDRGATQLRSMAIAIKGATSAENQWIVDGANATDTQRGIQGKAINSEFIQEVQVKTGGYQAEYGRALGGVINVVTKSGSNQFHGDGFYYYDSSSFQADQKIMDQDLTIANMKVVQYERHDYGADLGGYVWKDRLWFFGAYSRVDLPSQLSVVQATPLITMEDRFPLSATTNLYSGKLTWNAMQSLSAIASVLGDPTSNEGAGAADPRAGHGAYAPQPITNPERSTWYSTRFVGGVDYALQVTELFGERGMLVVQGAMHHDRFDLTAPEIVRVIDRTCEGGTPESPCAPTWPGAVSGGFGAVNGFTDSSHSQRGQLRADWSFYTGPHDLKMGADLQQARTDATSFYTGRQLVTMFNDSGPTYYRHQFFTQSLESEGVWTPAAVNDAVSKVQDFGVYVQDFWKPAAGLTVNLGLRWDRETIDGRLPAPIRTQQWEPRVGVAWDPSQDGRTRIYAFAGRFSWGLPTTMALRIGSNGASGATTWNFDPVDTTQSPNLPWNPPQYFNYVGNEPVDAHLKGIYQDEFSIGVERMLDPTLSLGVTATYRRLGRTIEDRCDLDGGQPETNFNTCALVNPGSEGSIARGEIPGCNGLDGDAYQCFDTIPATPAASRVYRGIEFLARKMIGDTLWLQASYVYSSLRGNYDGAISQTSGQTDPGINSDFDYYQFAHNDSGRLFLDRPNRFRFDGYYTTPFGLGVGLQAFAASGAPLDKLGYFNEQGYGAQIQLVQRGYAGRMPTLWDANLTLSYPIALGPATVTLQAYVFNLFNNQIPTWRDTVWSSTAPSDYPQSLYDPNQEQTNTSYGKVLTRSDPRSVRAAVRVSF